MVKSGIAAIASPGLGSGFGFGVGFGVGGFSVSSHSGKRRINWLEVFGFRKTGQGTRTRVREKTMLAHSEQKIWPHFVLIIFFSCSASRHILQMSAGRGIAAPDRGRVHW